MNSKEILTTAIKNAIKEHGMTLAEVASKMTNRDGKIGISQSSLTQTINGNATLDKLIEIANIVGCSVPELLGGSKFVPSQVAVLIDGKQYNYIASDNR